VLPMLLKQPKTDMEHNHQVRIAWGGGCPPEIWPEVTRRFGVELREGYGFSELITFVTINKSGPVGSCGKAIDYYDVKVIGDDGEPVNPGEIGEIYARARINGLEFLGYFRNDQAAMEAMCDEWYMTGDLAYCDKNNYLF